MSGQRRARVVVPVVAAAQAGTVDVMPVNPRILVLSPSAAVLAGIAATIKRRRPGSVLLGVHTADALVTATRNFRPTVTVVHGPLPDPGPRRPVVLARGDDGDATVILHAIRCHVTAVVSVDSDLDGLWPACRAARRGSPYLSRSLVDALVRHLAGGSPAAVDLTAREAQVLAHLTDGHSQSDISSALAISSRTVKYHLTNVYRKLGVHTQNEAIVLAYREGLVA